MITDSEPVAVAQYDNSSLAIDAKSLCKTYSDGLVFKKRFRALSNVSFTVKQGEVFGLLGPNGAGKTTFIKILLGIIRKTSGSATMLGQPAGSRAGRRLVGYLPEHLRIPPHLNAHTALECYGALSNLSKSAVREKRDGLLELVGLAGRAKDRCRKYSKGMLQRLGLAQALLHDPKLLILDEPTDGLDPQARAEMRQLIGRLKGEGVTIFLNSHLLQEVEMICDRVAILNRGHLKYCGDVGSIGDFVAKAAGVKPGLTVDIDVLGTPAVVNEVFEMYDFEIKSKTGDQSFTVQVSLVDQDDVDALLDSLRSKGVSVAGLTRQQFSLEDAFLKIINQDVQPPAAGSEASDAISGEGLTR